MGLGHPPREQRLDLVDREREISARDLEQLTRCSPPCAGTQTRHRSRGDDDVEPRRHRFDEALDDGIDLGLIHAIVVVEHENHFARQAVEQLVAQPVNDGSPYSWRALPRLESLTRMRLDAGQRGAERFDEVREKEVRIGLDVADVVPDVRMICAGQPGRDRGGLAISRIGLEDGQRMLDDPFERLIQARPRHDVRPHRRRDERVRTTTSSVRSVENEGEVRSGSEATFAEIGLGDKSSQVKALRVGTPDGCNAAVMPRERARISIGR